MLLKLKTNKPYIQLVSLCPCTKGEAYVMLSVGSLLKNTPFWVQDLLGKESPDSLSPDVPLQSAATYAQLPVPT